MRQLMFPLCHRYSSMIVMKWLAMIVILMIFAGCEKDDTKYVDRPLGAARIPVANAGKDIEIELPLSSPVTLNSSQSVNFEDIQWRKLSGPECLPLDSIISGDVDLALWLPGNYSFELTVHSRTSLSKDTVNIVAKGSPVCGDIPEKITMLFKDLTELELPYGSSVFLTAEDRVTGNDLGYFTPEHTRSIAIYDVPSQKLETHILKNGAYQMSVANTNAVFYMAGGIKDTSSYEQYYSDKVSIYDKNLHSWSEAKLSEAREQATGISAGDLIFFAGGINSTGPSATVDIYNQLTKKWSFASLSEARSDILAITDNRKIYFAGGSNNSGQSNKIDIYDIATGQWTVEQLSSRYQNLKGFIADNKVYFAGNAVENTNLKSVVEIKDLNGHSLGSSCLPAGISMDIQQTILATDDFVVVPGFTLSSFGSVINVFDKKTGKWKLLVPPKDQSHSFMSQNLLTYNNKLFGFVKGDYWDENTLYLFNIDL
jgi:hypothetical protein